MTDNDLLIKQALDTIKLLRMKLSDVTLKRKKEDDDPIVITGMSCQVPCASSVPDFWNQLMNKFDGVSCYPKKRWAMLAGDLQETAVNLSGIYGGYLSDIDLFNPGLFGISAREAKCMDPQQRLILMNTNQAIENAQIKDLPNFKRTGVFISLYPSEYVNLNSGYEMEDALFFSTGNALSMAANRLSYIYNFIGPSLVLDTACSSSLYGIELAIRYLKSEDIDYAIVGGVSINLFPFATQLLQDAKMLSPDGKCRSFDAAANGYVQGEGVGVIVLERYSNLKESSRRGYALIKGAAVNQDGRTNGLTAPNGIAQENIIKDACNKAGILPNQIQYIETHGTGTYLGDPIEVEAIGNVISDGRTSEQDNCVLGCLKTNIGHLEPAAGILSTIKVALCIVAGKIPGNNHLNKVNPLIQANRYPITLPQSEVPWKDMKKFAGVSAFGFGGSNGHLIMSNVEKEFSYTIDDIRRYSLASGTGKAYWYGKETRKTAQVSNPSMKLSSFLPYKIMDSPSELFRAVASFNSDQLLGGKDTGNFHVGFYIESIHKIMKEKFTFEKCLIKKIKFNRVFLLPEHANIDLQVIVNTSDEILETSQNRNSQITTYQCDFYVFIDHTKEWIQTGQADVCLYKDVSKKLKQKMLSSKTNIEDYHLTENEFYTRYGSVGFAVNGYIRAIKSISFSGNESVAELSLHKDAEMYSLGAHPGFLDAVLQPASLTTGVDKLYLTSKMYNISIHSTISKNNSYQLYTNVVLNDNEKIILQWRIYSKNSHLPVIDCEQSVLKFVGSKNDMLWMEKLSNNKPRDFTSLFDVVSFLLGERKEDIPLDKSMMDLGMNSIMIMALDDYLKKEKIAIQGNLSEFTLSKLLELRKSKGLPLIRSKDDTWFRWYRKNPENRKCLICVPYGFGCASLYKRWPLWINSACDVCAIQLPGREDRLCETPYNEMTALLKDLSPLVQSVTTSYKECYFYGHSMGALVSYCLCKDLVDQGHIKGLFVGGFSAPIQKVNPLVERIDKQMRSIGLKEGTPKSANELPDGALNIIMLNQNRSHENGKLRQLDLSFGNLKNLILSDFWIVKSYENTENKVLTIPIVVWHGVNDEYVSLKSSEEWELLTTFKTKFQVHHVNSSHNFIDYKAEEVATRLNREFINDI